MSTLRSRSSSGYDQEDAATNDSALGRHDKADRDSGEEVNDTAPELQVEEPAESSVPDGPTAHFEAGEQEPLNEVAKVLPSRVLAVSGGSIENSRGYANQDRWAAGTNADGAWAVLADGISGGPLGGEAAATAVAVAQSVLSSGPLDISAIYRAFLAAQSAVAPWYAGTEPGGTTLTIAALTDGKLLVGHVGDSPACMVEVDRDGLMSLSRMTSTPTGGRLMSWIGAQTSTEPIIAETDARDCSFVVLVSDGIDADHLTTTCSRPLPSSAALATASLLAGPAVSGDDATAVVIAVHDFLGTHGSSQTHGSRPEHPDLHSPPGGTDV